APRELEPAGDVVVVDVGLEDVGQRDAEVVEKVDDAVDVALRVDDGRDLAVGDEVAAVAEGGGLDGVDLHVGTPGPVAEVWVRVRSNVSKCTDIPYRRDHPF